MTWLLVPTQSIYINTLIAMQPTVELAALIDPVHARVSLDPLPHVVQFAGENYLEDGHNRTMRALLLGKRYILARVLTLP